MGEREEERVGGGEGGKRERDVVQLTLKKGMINWRRGWLVTVWISW